MEPIFNSKENKGLLWEVLLENQVFQKLPRDSSTQFQQFFDLHVDSLHDSFGGSSQDISLIEKNKKCIRETLQYIRDSSWESKFVLRGDNGVNSVKQIQERNMNEFEKRLLARQEEFSNMMNVSKPKEIDFQSQNSYNDKNDIIRLRRHDTVPEEQNHPNNSSEISKTTDGRDTLAPPAPLVRRKLKIENIEDVSLQPESILKSSKKVQFQVPQVQQPESDENYVTTSVFMQYSLQLEDLKRQYELMQINMERMAHKIHSLETSHQNNEPASIVTSNETTSNETPPNEV